MSLRSNTRDSINSCKIWLCYMKNKSKVKPQKYQWLKLNMLRLFKLKLSIRRKWWPKKEHLRLKFRTKTKKSRPLTLGSKRWQVSTRDKSQNWRKRSKIFAMIIKNGFRDKTSKLNNGTMNALKQRRKSTNLIFKSKMLKAKISNKKNLTKQNSQKRTWKFHHLKVIWKSIEVKSASFNQRCKLKSKILKRRTWTPKL